MSVCVVSLQRSPSLVSIGSPLHVYHQCVCLKLDVLCNWIPFFIPVTHTLSRIRTRNSIYARCVTFHAVNDISEKDPICAAEERKEICDPISRIQLSFQPVGPGYISDLFRVDSPTFPSFSAFIRIRMQRGRPFGYLVICEPCCR